MRTGVDGCAVDRCRGYFDGIGNRYGVRLSALADGIIGSVRVLGEFPGTESVGDGAPVRVIECTINELPRDHVGGRGSVRAVPLSDWYEHPYPLPEPIRVRFLPSEPISPAVARTLVAGRRCVPLSPLQARKDPLGPARACDVQPRKSVMGN